MSVSREFWALSSRPTPAPDENRPPRVDFVNSGYVLRASERVDDARMAARVITTSPTVADPKAGSVFVPMLIGHRIPGEFFGGEMVICVGVGVAAKPVPAFFRILPRCLAIRVRSVVGP